MNGDVNVGVSVSGSTGSPLVRPPATLTSSISDLDERISALGDVLANVRKVADSFLGSSKAPEGTGVDALAPADPVNMIERLRIRAMRLTMLGTELQTEVTRIGNAI